MINAAAEAVTLRVENRGDRPIQVGSQYRFAGVNPALSFDREAAWGRRLNVLSDANVVEHGRVVSRQGGDSPCAGESVPGRSLGPPDQLGDAVAVSWWRSPRAQMSRYLTVEKVAEALHVSASWVYQAQGPAGRCPARKASQGLGKVWACLVGDGRVSEGVGAAWFVGHDETGP
jgi:hypothetical protein